MLGQLGEELKAKLPFRAYKAKADTAAVDAIRETGNRVTAQTPREFLERAVGKDGYLCLAAVINPSALHALVVPHLRDVEAANSIRSRPALVQQISSGSGTVQRVPELPVAPTALRSSIEGGVRVPAAHVLAKPYPAVPEKVGGGDRGITLVVQSRAARTQAANARWDRIAENQRGMASIPLPGGIDLRIPRVREFLYYARQFKCMGVLGEVFEVLYDEYKHDQKNFDKHFGDLETDDSLRRRFGAEKMKLIEDLSKRTSKK